VDKANARLEVVGYELAALIPAASIVFRRTCTIK
jgi:hypothetical protein